MKTLFALLIVFLAVANAQAQRSNRERSHDGLVLMSSPRSHDRQYRLLNRMNYWTSRYDRYWSKFEKFASKDFINEISRSTRNLSHTRNGWNSDRYSTKDSERKKGLIKIN